MSLKISIRGQSMPESPIRKLVPYAEKAKANGIEVFHLNIGQPDIETPPSALQAVKDFSSPIVEYSHSAGNESYRKKLAEAYQRSGINVDYSEIIITTGGSEAIIFGFMACCDPDDEIIIPEPFYANYNSFALQGGIKVVPIASSIETGFALPPVADFEKLITSKTKGIAICNPNNPTGYVYSNEEMQTLKELVIKHNLFLFSDEAYREFCYDSEPFSALNLEGAEQNVVLIDTISKRYSACGARIGALITKNKDLYKTVMKFAQARLSPPTFGQVLGEAATALPGNYFDETKAEYKKRRDTLVSRLQKMPGVFCPNPGGAFYAMAKLPVDDAEDFCQWLLESFSYNGKTVMVSPAPGFYATKGLGKDEVRFAYVLNSEKIEQAMDIIEEALKVYKNNIKKINL